MKQFFKYLLLSVLVLFAACNQDTGADLNSVLDELQQTVKGMKSKVTESEIDSMASEEVEKLFAFEYTVHEIAAGQDSDALTEELSQLGKDRWNCFHVEENNEYIRLFCKRRPKSYLRYVPRFF